MLTVDYRERALIGALGIEHHVKALAVGDFVCTYEDGTGWIAERKSACDMARSIIDGRWSDQMHRLHATGLPMFLIIEGDLAATSLNYNALLSACLNVTVRKGSHLIRSCHVEETAAIVSHLVQKMDGAPPGVPSGIRPPALVLGKRKRDAENVWVRQLMCIPSISERIARKLLEEFGSLPALQRALADLDTFPKVRLDEKSCLGKARLKHLATYLTEPSAAGASAQ